MLCYSTQGGTGGVSSANYTQGGTGGVSFANKNVSGLQKCFIRFQNEYNKVENGNWTSCRAILDWNQTCDYKSWCYSE